MDREGITLSDIDRERQILRDFTYMWSPTKQNERTNLTKHKESSRCREQVSARQEVGRWRKAIGEEDKEVQTSSCKINESWVWV